MEKEHKLKIESLRDPRARCVCGRWSYGATSSDHETNEEVREAIVTQFEFHRAKVEFEERRLRERPNQSPSAGAEFARDPSTFRSRMT